MIELKNDKQFNVLKWIFIAVSIIHVIYATIAIDYEKKLLDINNGEIDDATLTNSYVMSLDKFYNGKLDANTLGILIHQA